MAVWAPPPAMKVGEWAAERLYLSPEDSDLHGKYSAEIAPYQTGIMNAFNEEGVEEIVVKSSSQIGKTLVLKAACGYFMDVDPSPILVVQPTGDMAETFSKDRLAPMIRDTPSLRGKVRDAKSRDSGNTILRKQFLGGHITMIGANAPAGLASRPIRVLLFDEVDRYPPSAGTEGDPVDLGRKRAITYRHRKRVALFSTPTIKGKSRIDRAWLLSDQRQYFVPCPHCGHRHVLSWSNVSITDDDPSTAMLRCPECAALIGDEHKQFMLRHGEWVKGSPRSKVAGFHINELYSPWRKFAEIATDYNNAKGNPEQEKTWWNTSMGETFEDVGTKVDGESMMSRREAYDGDELPEEVFTIAAGVDCQDDRLEIEIVGWGAGEESWGIEYHVLPGKPSLPDVWATLDDMLLNARFTTKDGRRLRIAACCIDSGGHHTQEVYEFCTPRVGRNIWATMGRFGAIPVWPKRASVSKKHVGHTVRVIGVDTAKETVYSRWQIADRGVAGYCHFPTSYDHTWFHQATIERRITTYDKRGREVRTWKCPRGARNEATDCRVLAYAALQGLKIERRMVLRKSEAPPEVKTEPKQKEIESASKPVVAARRVMQSRYLSRR